MDFKDIAIRALKTGVQSFLAGATVLVIVGGDVPALKAAAIAAAAAALSVIHNAILQWSQS